MIGGGGGALKEGAARAGGLVQGAQNMVGRGREMIDYGRQFAGGMGNAIRNRDFGGAMNQINEGIGRFGQMGRGMYAEGQNMYDQGRDAYRFGRGVVDQGMQRYNQGVMNGRVSQGRMAPAELPNGMPPLPPQGFGMAGMYNPKGIRGAVTPQALMQSRGRLRKTTRFL
jgi:hypothetical protein